MRRGFAELSCRVADCGCGLLLEAVWNGAELRPVYDCRERHMECGGTTPL
ncbi:hypothetical protein [Haloferula sp. BvORR071]|nr:hypothetical protein [Haloferula sp. BvORR071]